MRILALLSSFAAAALMATALPAAEPDKVAVGDFTKAALSELLTMGPDNGPSEGALRFFETKASREAFLRSLENAGTMAYLSETGQRMSTTEIAVGDVSILDEDLGEVHWEVSGVLKSVYSDGEAQKEEMFRFRTEVREDAGGYGVEKVTLGRPSLRTSADRETERRVGGFAEEAIKDILDQDFSWPRTAHTDLGHLFVSQNDYRNFWLVFEKDVLTEVYREFLIIEPLFAGVSIVEQLEEPQGTFRKSGGVWRAIGSLETVKTSSHGSHRYPTRFEMLITQSGDGYAITSLDLDIAKDPSAEL